MNKLALGTVFGVSIASVAYFYVKNNRKHTVSEFTKKALNKSLQEGDKKTQQWIETSISQGYEGAGVLPYILTKEGIEYVLGLKYDDIIKQYIAEYPGGKCEIYDDDSIDTAKREMEEECKLLINRNRFENSHRFTITGGTTGYPSFLYLVQISDKELNDMKTNHSHFNGFTTTKSIFGSDTVKDSRDGNIYQLRKFNRKYVLPQIEQEFKKVMSGLE